MGTSTTEDHPERSCKAVTRPNVVLFRFWLTAPIQPFLFLLRFLVDTISTMVTATLWLLRARSDLDSPDPRGLGGSYEVRLRRVTVSNHYLRCGLLRREVLTSIVRNVVGDAPVDDRPMVDFLPSPVALPALLVHTVDVKGQSLNKKEVYAPQHVFSLSEHIANELLRDVTMDFVERTQ